MKKAFLYVLIILCIPHAAHAQLIERLCGGHMPCTYEQFKAGMMEWFRRADTNHDGVVDAQERATVWRLYVQDTLPACTVQDINVLNLSHVPSENQIHAFFTQADANGDGVIDLGEEQHIEALLNQTCEALHDPRMQKIQQMLRQLKQ
jgi:Ca2+-binding EF-hand superfamily protein